MKQKIIKRASYWLGVVVVGITLGLVLQFARAWTEPATTPPGGNLGAPLNTSENLQVKSGALGVNSNAWIPGTVIGANTGLTVGGKSQADDFCLNSDPTKCLSSTSLAGLRVGPPGCNSILTPSTTCNTDMCGLSCGGGQCYYCGPVSTGCAAIYRTCGGSCSASSSKSCSTAPLGTSFLSGAEHSTDACTAAGGVAMQDGSESFCKFDRTSCPSSWTQFKNWSATTARTCTGTTDNTTNCPVSSCATAGHDTFSDTAPESCSYKSSRSWTSNSCCSSWIYDCTSWGTTFATDSEGNVYYDIPYCASYGWICSGWYDCSSCVDSLSTCFANITAVGCY